MSTKSDLIGFNGSMFVNKSNTEIYDLMYDEVIKIISTKILYRGRINSILRSLIKKRHKSIYDLVHITKDEIHYMYKMSESDYSLFKEIQEKLKRYYNVPKYISYVKF